MPAPSTIPLPEYRRPGPDEMLRQAETFRTDLQRRRSVRDFDPRPVSREVITECIRAAGTAPSGANLQPWFFAAVGNADLKRRIRQAAEKVESDFYRREGTRKWVSDLAQLGTDAKKPFLEQAPWLIAVFAQRYGVKSDGSRQKHYYMMESVGIAAGLLLAAIHRAGLAALTYTPANMAFLNPILGRPDNERPYLIMVVGHPAVGCRVPAIGKKRLVEIAAFH
jgi:iodotyrosine deiodinase